MRNLLGRLRRPISRSQLTKSLTLISDGDGSTLSLDFTAMGSLDSRFTFTRASTGTYINSAGLVTTMAAASTNDPTKARFDYDPTTLAPRGLLIEGSATNLLNWSESFATSGGGTVWSYNTYITRNATQIVSPDGTQNAYRFNETIDNQIHRISTSVTGSAGAHVLSVWVQIIDGSAPRRLYINAVAFMGAGALFDIDPATQTGASGSAVAVSGTAANRAGTWVKYPNNWYRCSLLGTYVANQTIYLQINRASSTTATDDTFAGSTSNGLALWGAQLEAGSGASSYVASGASQGQRAADDLQLTGSNFSSIWPSGLSEWSVYWSGDITRAPATTQFVWLTRAVGSSRTRGFVTTGSSIRSSNNIADLTPGLNATVNTVFKMAIGFKNADCFMWAHNGTTTASAAETASGLQTDSDRLLFNVNADNFMHIRQFKFWQSRLSNGTLQGLVS